MFPLQASARADDALHNARKTREAVGKTLNDVKSLLSAVGGWSSHFVTFHLQCTDATKQLHD